MMTVSIPAPPLQGIDLRVMMQRCMQKSVAQVCSESETFHPYLFCYINGQEGQSVCTHKSYPKALAALLREVSLLPASTNCYAISYYGTINYSSAVFVEGFVGNAVIGHVLCQKIKTKGFLKERKVPYGEPVYLGEKRIMTQCTFADRLAHAIKVLLKQD